MQIGAGMLGAAGNLAGMIPMVGGPIAALGKLGEVTFKAVDRLRDWTEGLHNANMQFAEFSSAMSSVEAEQKVRDIELSMTRGERRAESAGYLARGKHRLNEEVTPIEDAFANAKNYIGGALANGTAEVVKWLRGIFSSVEYLKYGLDHPDEDTPLDMNEFLEAIAKKRFEEVYKDAPPRWNPWRRD
jgi:hypothetical protein